MRLSEEASIGSSVCTISKLVNAGIVRNGEKESQEIWCRLTNLKLLTLIVHTVLRYMLINVSLRVRVLAVDNISIVTTYLFCCVKIIQHETLQLIFISRYPIFRWISTWICNNTYMHEVHHAINKTLFRYMCEEIQPLTGCYFDRQVM